MSAWPETQTSRSVSRVGLVSQWRNASSRDPRARPRPGAARDRAGSCRPRFAAVELGQEFIGAQIAGVFVNARTDFDRVLKATVILARRDDWRRMNEIYSAYFPSGRFPARTAYGAPVPHPDFLDEVECVAEVS